MCPYARELPVSTILKSPPRRRSYGVDSLQEAWEEAPRHGPAPPCSHAGLSWRAARNTAARNTEDRPSGLRWQLSHQAAPELAGRLSRRGDSVNDVMHTVLHGACESMPMADKIAPNGNSAVLDPADEQLARILVLMWSLASGRRLPSAVRPDELSAEELIEFWADDLRPATGRHARGSARDKAAALLCRPSDDFLVAKRQ
jgi:hypothetical protein